jgi:hypothetical protein
MGLKIADCRLRIVNSTLKGLCFHHGPAQSAIRNPQSEIRNAQSAMRNSQWKYAIPPLTRLLTFVVLALLAGCAKTGDPQPPLLLVPKPATDLAARQYGDQIMLTLSMPTENTNGTPATTLRRIELFRCMEPDRSGSAPLSTELFIDGATRIQSIESDKLPDYLHDKTLVFRDELALPDRSLTYKRAFRYSVVFVNKKGQSAGFGNQVFIAPVAIPVPPSNLSGEVFQDFVRLRWTPPSSNMDGSVPPRIAGYNIYRSEDRQKFAPAPLNSQPVQTSEYEDRAFHFDKAYFYALSVVGSRENPSAESMAGAPVEVRTRDTFPPDAPPRLDLVLENGVVVLLWIAPAARDVHGYRIYRKEAGGAERQLLRQELVNALSFRDALLSKGRKYVYQVTAVDTHGNEGPAAEGEIEVP